MVAVDAQAPGDLSERDIPMLTVIGTVLATAIKFAGQGADDVAEGPGN